MVKAKINDKIMVSKNSNKSTYMFIVEWYEDGYIGTKTIQSYKKTNMLTYFSYISTSKNTFPKDFHVATKEEIQSLIISMFTMQVEYR